MKPFERIPFLANVLTAVCKRPAAEVGKLVKAVVTYVTEGTRTDLDDLACKPTMICSSKTSTLCELRQIRKARNVARAPSAGL